MKTYTLSDGNKVEISIVVYPSSDPSKVTDYWWWYKINEEPYVGFNLPCKTNSGVDEFMENIKNIKDFLLSISSMHPYHKVMIDLYINNSK